MLAAIIVGLAGGYVEPGWTFVFHGNCRVWASRVCRLLGRPTTTAGKRDCRRNQKQRAHIITRLFVGLRCPDNTDPPTSVPSFVAGVFVRASVRDTSEGDDTACRFVTPVEVLRGGVVGLVAPLFGALRGLSVLSFVVRVERHSLTHLLLRRVGALARVSTAGKDDHGGKDGSAHRVLLGQRSRLELAHHESSKLSSAGLRRQLGIVVTEERKVRSVRVSLGRATVRAQMRNWTLTRDTVYARKEGALTPLTE